MSVSGRFRYRTLSEGGDYEVEPVEGRGAFRAFNALSAQAGAVHTVNTFEADGEFADLVEQLKTGELSPSDLVFSGGRWVTFSESAEFFEACEGIVDRKARAHQVRSILLGVGAIAAFVLLFVLRVLAD